MGGGGGFLSSPGRRNLTLQQSRAQISQLLPVFLLFLYGKLTGVLASLQYSSGALDVGPQGLAPTQPMEEMRRGLLLLSGRNQEL